MPTIAELAVKVTADTKDAEAGLDSVGKKAQDAGDNMEKGGEKGESGLGHILSGAKEATGGIGEFVAHMAEITGAMAIVDLAGEGFHALTDQIGEVITAGMQANQVDAQIAAGLKSTHDASGMTTDSLNKLADSLTAQTGISNDAVKSAESMLLTFTNIGKNTFPQATQAVADLATKMANGAVPSTQQMEQASIQLGKALGNPLTGFTALQRVGVTFDAQQKEQIKNFMKVGDVAGAQAVILGEMNKEFGGSAAAAGQANGGLAIFSAELDSMKEQIGQAVIPVLVQLGQAGLPVFQALASAVQILLPPVSEFVQDIFNLAGPVANGIAQLLGLGGAFKGLQSPASLVSGVASELAKDIGQADYWINTFVAGVLNGVGPLGGFHQTFLAVQTFIATQVIPTLSSLRDWFLSQVLPAIMQFAGFVATNVIPVVLQFAGFVAQNVVPIIQQLATIFITDVLPALERIWTAIATSLIPAVENLWNKISPVLIPALQVLGAVISTVVGPALAGLVGIIASVINTISNLVVWFQTVPAQAQTAFQAAQTTVQSAITAIQGILNGALTGVQNFWNQWQTPILVTAGILSAIFGPALIQAGAQAVIAGAQIAGSFIANVAASAAAGAVAAAQGVAAFVTGLISTGAEAAATAATVVTTLIPAIIAQGAAMLAAAVGGIASAITGLIGYAAAGWAAAAATIAATWPILAIIAAVALLAAGIFVLVTHWQQVSDWLGSVWHAVVGQVQVELTGLGTIISNVASGIGDAFKGGIDAVIGDINGFISFLDSIQIHIPAIGVGPVSTPAFDWNGLGIPQIPYLASGGDVFPGGQAVVGEAGPELLSVYGSGARVQPLSGAAGAGGGQVLQSTFIIQLDGQVLARSTVKHLPGAIHVTTGARGF